MHARQQSLKTRNSQSCSSAWKLRHAKLLSKRTRNSKSYRIA